MCSNTPRAARVSIGRCELGARKRSARRGVSLAKKSARAKRRQIFSNYFALFVGDCATRAAAVMWCNRRRAKCATSAAARFCSSALSPPLNECRTGACRRCAHVPPRASPLSSFPPSLPLFCRAHRSQSRRAAAMRLPSFLRARHAPHHAQPRTVQLGVCQPHFGHNAVKSAKYNWFNMLPKAIYEQFRRLSNFYFLIVAIISFIPDISPTSPITTTLPLLVVIGFGLARDVYEDLRRKRADYAINSAPVIIQKRSTRPQPSNISTVAHSAQVHHLLQHYPAIPKSQLTCIQSQHLYVGDVVLVTEGSAFPADLILLKSSDPTGVCYVSTANLDGESNLKRRLIPPNLHSQLSSAEQLQSLPLTVVTAPPTPELYTVQGSVSCQNSHSYPLDTSNMLLRGSILRNTDFIYALVVYNGEQTKVALNMRNPPSKLGGIERMMNRVVIGLFAMLMLLTIVTSILAGVLQRRYGLGQWYMRENRLLSGQTVSLRSIGTYVILYHTFVPVSLFVTLEFVRLIQGLFISFDPKMYTGKVSVEAKANNLNETLGYVQHIFSDKTGTLTENVMRFVACHTNHESYDLRNDANSLQHGVQSNASSVNQLVRAMALSHDVVPRQRDASAPSRSHYYGESPDEVALVQAAADAGVVLINRTLSEFVIQEHGNANSESYELLAELEFSSDRKRMSTILRCPDGAIRMFSKGADSVMIRLLKAQSDVDDLLAATERFSMDGLRTLVYGGREIPRSEYDEWAPKFAEASNAIEDRTSKKARVASLIERRLDLYGVTAVEDKLQRKVPETIRFFREAGIRIWVLTGDKLETAENIGYSSHLLSNEMRVFRIQASSQSELLSVLEDITQELYPGPASKYRPAHRRSLSGESIETFTEQHTRIDHILDSLTLRPHELMPERPIALIVDGTSLSFIDDEEMERRFLRVASVCKSVICARVTPIQKAQTVQLVQRHENCVTLAIGDGGNDVSMIQEAQIGVGIKGKEGMQAARAADYSMGEFRHLARLLAIHGRFSYIRTAGVINLSFYKNIFFSATQFLFQFFCFSSGTTIHNQWIVTMWNSALTLAPPFLYGIFERDLEESTVLRFPKVYSSNGNNRLFNFKSVLEFTTAYSVWHALVLFFLTFFFFGQTTKIVFSNGHDAGLFLTGLAISTMAVCIALFKFLLSSHLWTGIVLAGILLSFAGMWALIPAFVAVFHERELEGVLPKLWSSGLYHLLWPIVFVTAFLPDFLVILIRMRRKGSLVTRLQQYEARNGRF
eukprot:TRINITY_DN733_c0_g2_i1.p1 TRINITY_DN733_c0_g2~~TRINITY_DN733_c0_g2_i1.p1  ORF type:complete len:1259 (+),score=191.16 TRINITY_DN733_c0_g2_i1:1156-4932(+)